MASESRPISWVTRWIFGPTKSGSSINGRNLRDHITHSQKGLKKVQGTLKILLAKQRKITPVVLPKSAQYLTLAAHIALASGDSCSPQLFSFPGAGHPLRLAILRAWVRSSMRM